MVIPSPVAFSTSSRYVFGWFWLAFNTGDLQKDAIWLRGLAHIKNNNFEAAKADLRLTAQIKGWKKAEEADKILRSIGDKN